MERKITIEEHVLYKEDYQMKMLKANSPEGFLHVGGDRKSTRLNSSHTVISYAVYQCRRCMPDRN